MSIFAEAYAQMTGSGLAGQEALAAFYDAVPRGDVVSSEILPIVAQIMSERAQPKLGIMRESSIAQQARVRNEMADLLSAWSQAGGERGFANLFRNVAEQLPRLTPLVEGLAVAFESLTDKLSFGFGVIVDYVDMLSRVKEVMDGVNISLPMLDTNLTTVAAAVALLTTRFGRLLVPFTAMFLILEDLAVGAQGGVAVSNYLFDFLDRFIDYERDILAVATAFLTVAGAITLMRRAGGLGLPGRGNRDRNAPQQGKGQGRAGLAVGAVGGGILASMMGDEYSTQGILSAAGLGFLVGGPKGAAITAAGYGGYHLLSPVRDYLNFAKTSPEDFALYSRLSGPWENIEQYTFPNSVVSREYAESLGLGDAYSKAYMLRLPQERWAEYLSGMQGEYQFWDNVDGYLMQRPEVADQLSGSTLDDVMKNSSTNINNSPTMNNYITLNLEGADFGNLQSEVETSIVPTLEEALHNAIQGMLIDTDISYGAD